MPQLAHFTIIGVVGGSGLSRTTFIIIPEGDFNTIALDMVVARIETMLEAGR